MIQRALQAESAHLKYDQLDPVCVIYAGGTVGMVHQEASDIIHADYEIAGGVDAIVKYMRSRLFALPFNMHFFSLENPIDSSNVTASDWVDLAKLIREQMANYQGFVILHGTNTLAYTASALSFLLEGVIDKPVILTGAEVPISIQNTDATHNVENAIRAAAWQAYNGPMLVPEVCVFWNNHLYRGNRATKKYASDRTEGFHAPNVSAPLATLSNEKLYVDNAQLLVRAEHGSTILPRMRGVIDLSHVKVAVLFIHPDMDFSELEKKYPVELDGLILLSYGPGNVPEDPRFISHIKRLVDAGTIVCNVTQCPYGRVELKLFETSAILFDLGVADAYDMTLEAAYTKLLWAIARRGRGRQVGVRESIKQTFQRNIAGEMSASIYDADFGASAQFFDGGGPEDSLISDVRSFDRVVNRYDIAEAFIRLEGVHFPKDITRGTIRIYFGRAPDQLSNSGDDTLLAEFSKRVTNTDGDPTAFDKNLAVTHPFRKWFNNEEFQVSVALDSVGTGIFVATSRALFALFEAIVVTYNDVPAEVAANVRFLTEREVWHVLSRNPPVRGCAEASRQRRRLGNVGIPLCDELKSSVGKVRYPQGVRYAVVHCRGHQYLDEQKLEQQLDGKFERLSVEELNERFGAAYGSVTPTMFVAHKEVTQIVDSTILKPFFPPYTMMTNLGHLEYAFEFYPSDVFACIPNVVIADVVSGSQKGPVAHTIGILTGNAPESGILLWEKINQRIRESSDARFRGDISFPRVLIESVPEMGLSMETVGPGGSSQRCGCPIGRTLVFWRCNDDLYRVQYNTVFWNAY